MLKLLKSIHFSWNSFSGLRNMTETITQYQLRFSNDWNLLKWYFFRNVRKRRLWKPTTWLFPAEWKILHFCQSYITMSWISRNKLPMTHIEFRIGPKLTFWCWSFEFDIVKHGVRQFSSQKGLPFDTKAHTMHNVSGYYFSSWCLCDMLLVVQIKRAPRMLFQTSLLYEMTKGHTVNVLFYLFQ